MITVILDGVGVRVHVHVLVDDELFTWIRLVSVDLNCAFAGLGKTCYAQDVASAFLIDVMSGLQIIERIEGCRVTWLIPDLPHGPIFTAKFPKNEGADAELASGAKFVQQSYAIEKPDDVARVGVFVDVFK